MPYRWIRPALFRLDPELAHGLALSALRLTGALPPLGATVRALLAVPAGRPVQAFGLRFPNALGVAAGFDKDALAWRGLGRLGFGHVEIGTVTPDPQPGNARPRVFRLTEDDSLINRLGFPSRGAAFVLRRLSAPRPRGLIVGVNLGKQRTTPVERAADDYERLIRLFAGRADYLAINVSSPNTPDLRRLQTKSRLEPLLRRLSACRRERAEAIGRPVPLLLKLDPDLPDEAMAEAVEAILAAGLDGIIATNTTLDRSGLRSPRAAESGGLSGAALTARSTDRLRRICRRTADRVPVIACGGVMNADDARAKLDAGARLVQVYTGLVYRGPGLLRELLRAI